MANDKLHTISEDTGVEFADAGCWRSYELHADGYTADDMRRLAHICEIDQDGGCIRSYDLCDAPSEVVRVSEGMIESVSGMKISKDWDDQTQATTVEHQVKYCPRCFGSMTFNSDHGLSWCDQDCEGEAESAWERRTGAGHEDSYDDREEKQLEIYLKLK